MMRIFELRHLTTAVVLASGITAGVGTVHAEARLARITTKPSFLSGSNLKIKLVGDHGGRVAAAVALAAHQHGADNVSTRLGLFPGQRFVIIKRAETDAAIDIKRGLAGWIAEANKARTALK